MNTDLYFIFNYQDFLYQYRQPLLLIQLLTIINCLLDNDIAY